jgi:7,8-didemethyl-8-hydroxy-5-deazariboflavin synthase CofH subunit/7,8-didemethyl-8-hydroxy-5-deazariboflavin synthase CofG subunit
VTLTGRQSTAPDSDQLSDADLLGTDTAALASAAAARRDALFGTRVTFSPKVFIPLTMLCRDRCGYCTFAKPPARLGSPYLHLDEVIELARSAAALGCHEALFTLGERPEERYPVAASFLSAAGASSTVSYLAEACRVVRDETGLLPHANAGALFEEELALLRPVTASQGMMIETLSPTLSCHRAAPDKTPARRLATLEAAGRLQIPFTTGILVGIGETRADRLTALRAIADAHRRHGHVQEVIVQNFLPKPGTSMHSWPACPVDELVWSVAAARLLLPADVHVQAPPNLTEDFGILLQAGIDDWGGVSPVTVDHVNPDRAWPVLDRLRSVTEEAGHVLAPRLCIHPEYAAQPDRFLDEKMRFAVLDRSDGEHLGRDSSWCSGGDEPPPLLIGRPRRIGRSFATACPGLPAREGAVAPAPAAGPGNSPFPTAAHGRPGGAVREALAGALAGQQLGEREIVTLFSARGREVEEVAAAADDLRRRTVGDVVTWVANRNINYTNVCTFKCRFCAFSKGPLSLNLRGSPYLLELDEITRRVAEAEGLGATEVCLQGGIHPSFDGDYYLEVLGAVRRASETIHIHGFTALEVHEGARRLGEDLETYLRRLQAAGLKTLPGTAAEILDDTVRAILCPDKIDTERWLEVHRCAHRVGLRSNVTIMFGSVEGPRSWARHIVATRALQLETGGFTEFVPLPFVHMAAPLYLQHRARRGPTFREALLMHAVGRLAYAGAIDNIQASWVKMGATGARQLLRAGCNDLGGTLMDENISRAAGATHGQAMDEASFGRIVEPLGRPLAQRTTLYGRPEPAGSVVAPG